MFYSSDNQFRELVDKLHDKIQPIVCDVDEHLKAMENSAEATLEQAWHAMTLFFVLK